MSNRIRPILLAIKLRIEQMQPQLTGLIEGLGNAPQTIFLPVLIRKAPVFRSGLDLRAMITVSKSRTPEAVTRRRFGLWQTEYLVDVTVVSPFDGPDADTSEYEAIRDGLVDAFKAKPLYGAADVFELDARPASWLQPYGQETEWNWASLVVAATVAHA